VRFFYRGRVAGLLLTVLHNLTLPSYLKCKKAERDR